jgi:diadenylate cyclase
MDISLIPLVEIFILSIFINYLLSFLWNTRSMDLFLGLLGFFTLIFISSWFNLPILQKIVYVVANVAIVAIVIIFQPELRTALSKFGVKQRKNHDNLISEQLITQLTETVFKLAERKQGALIVIENQVSISDFARHSTKIDALFTSELIESIFTPLSPLHDGAVLIKNKKIFAAGAILPLADESHASLKGTGTRHKAGLGASLETDALIIVISEEKGEVSIAREGLLTKGLKQDRFKNILTSLFFTDSLAQNQPKKTFQFIDWLRQ